MTESAVTDPGGLIQMDMDSQVGVLLDELPVGPIREAAAANAIAQGAQFWKDRATRQTRLTGYRLVFRSYYYNGTWANGNPTYHGALPLTPKSTWTITLTGSPQRVQIEGHDLVTVTYHFRTTQLTDVNSPGISDPSLGTIGGTTSEPFTLPADPEQLVERTGLACADEDEFPPNTLFEKNIDYFYDDTCTKSGPGLCHVTGNPQNSCNAELGQMVGRINTSVNFTRLAWSASLANSVRVGTTTAAAVNPPAPDLAVVQDYLVNEHAFRWQFFTSGSCDLEEGDIAQLGWRRVLMFSAVLQNNGRADMNVGDPGDANNPFVQANDFEFSPCHQHYHFSHYGTFSYAGLPGAKRAFCLEDTNRYHNDETTALDEVHSSCEKQGISPGWGDEYNWGIPGQWVDVTGYSNKKAQTLSFTSNPDQFLCEGTYARDAQGNLILDPTSFLNPANGQPEDRIRCNFLTGWNSNNFGSTQVLPGAGSFVTDPCTNGEVGPGRDCGYAQHPSFLHDCTSGSTVTLTCHATTSAQQVLRICEKTGQWNTGVACTLADAKVNAVIGSANTQVTFACPAVRDATFVNGVPQTVAGVGAYSVYQASIGTLASSDNGPQPAISCTGW